MTQKVIYFENDGQRYDYCRDQVYQNFIDYAFNEADYFMLVYESYYRKGLNSRMKYFKNALSPHKVKRRTNPSWPGVPFTFTLDNSTAYQIVFYRCAPEAKEFLKEVSMLSAWTRPQYPEDLAFFKGNKCWFYSIGHEKIAGFIDATEKDIDFVETQGLARRSSAKDMDCHVFDSYNELIEV